MNQLFQIASKVSSAWSLAAFAIIALVVLIVKLRGRKIPPVAWGVVAAIVVIALAPIVAPAYMSSYGIYRVRVVVLDDRQMPTNDAKVTCSTGGEIKKVEGGWECDFPAKTKAEDGKMQAYAMVANAFLTGRAELELKDDYSPVLTVPLKRDMSATIRGIVVDLDHHDAPLEGVRVGVVGYEAEAQITHQGGNFVLPAHAANDQQVRLFAYKDGYEGATEESHPAGDSQVTIKLRPLHAARRSAKARS